MSEPPKPAFPSFGGTFSSGANTGSGSAPPTSLFGNNNAPSAFTTPAQPSGGLFGSGSAGGGGSLFGNASNTVTAPGSSNISSTPFGGSSQAGQPSQSGASGSAGNTLFGSSAAQKPAGNSFFNLANNSSSTNQESTSATTPSLFGQPSKPSDSTSSGTAPPSTSTLFSGGLFKKPDAPTTTPSPAPTSAPATSTIFGGFGAKKDDATKEQQKEAGPAAPVPAFTGLFSQTSSAPKDSDGGSQGAVPVLGSLFGGSSTTTGDKKESTGAEKKDTATSLPTFPLGGSSAPQGAATQSQGSSAVPANTTTALCVPPPSMLRGKTIEEIVNKWSSDLETHVREFTRLAGEVAVWDRTLIDNGNTIAALYQHVMIAEREQNDVEQSLNHVEQQQKELAATLDMYEKSSKDVFDGQGGSLRALDVGPADAERDKNYTLATDLTTQLDDLSRSLSQMVDSVNDMSETSSDSAEGKSKADEPLEQISHILSSHLETLQWIDGAVRDVESKVRDVEKRIKDSTPVSVGTNGSGFNTSSRSRGFGLNQR